MSSSIFGYHLTTSCQSSVPPGGWPACTCSVVRVVLFARMLVFRVPRVHAYVFTSERRHRGGRRGGGAEKGGMWKSSLSEAQGTNTAVQKKEEESIINFVFVK